MDAVIIAICLSGYMGAAIGLLYWTNAGFDTPDQWEKRTKQHKERNKGK
jgi:hypothetical protein